MATETPIVLVTGGSRGIGAATARMAAQRGFDVAVNYVRDRVAADAVVADVEKCGQRAIAIAGDMARDDDIARVFATTERGLGRITHLVYNAGITGTPSRMEEANPRTFREVFDLNVIGALVSVQAAIRQMSTKHGGRGGNIVLISSGAATLGAPNSYVWYAASKAAIDTMALGLGLELVGEGIRVNAVAPGIILTDIHPPGRLEKVVPTVPMERAGTAEEVAEAILYLMSDASSYVTGTVLRVAGGR